MNNFLLFSIIGSVTLTVLLNVLPLIFPKTSIKMQKKIEENAKRAIQQHEDENQPSLKILFPWKAMLVISLMLTVLINAVFYFAV